MITFAVIAAVAAALPAAILGIECCLALLPIRRHPKLVGAVRTVVLVPAHNEQDWVAHTVNRVRQQIDSGTEIIVIADNCGDATAARARAAGAEVWERDDPTHLGKAYAMNFALARLAENPPDVVVCIDADCVPGPEAIVRLAQLAHHYCQPVQAAYIMNAPNPQPGLSQISAFAVFVKNVIRPRGLQRVGLPCLLNGSGMAFPWSAMAAASYPEEQLSDDYRFTSDLAVAGFLPVPCTELTVTSVLPDRHSGFITQRTRWEQGHLTVALHEPPRILAALVRNRNWRMLALIPEIAIPPLSFLVGFTMLCVLIFTAIAWELDSWSPLVCYLVGAAAGGVGLALVWLREGRQILPGNAILQIPTYIAIKAPLYSRFVTNRQRTWLRTDRGRFRFDAEAGVSGPVTRPELDDSKVPSVT